MRNLLRRFFRPIIRLFAWLIYSPVSQGIWLIAGAFIFALWIVPWLVVSQDRQEITGIKLVEVQNQIRGLAIQFLGGMALFIGAIALWRRIEKSVETAQGSQITERFTRAVELLGSDKIETRLGGIYALERIARDSARDHWTIMETFTAFVRVHRPARDYNDPAPPSALPADIQVILTVLGRRSKVFHHGEDDRLNLAATDLRLGEIVHGQFDGALLSRCQLEASRMMGASLVDADLSSAYLAEANLNDACLDHADLTGAFLKDASLVQASLAHARLMKANFDGANLGQAHLKNADARSANFESADLSETNLDGANLRHANLRGANFCNASLRGADLRFARGLTPGQIYQAIVDSDTMLPDYLLQETAEEDVPVDASAVE